MEHSVLQLLISLECLLNLGSTRALFVRLMNCVGHVDHVRDELWKDLTLRGRIQENSRIDIDLKQDRAEITIKHEIKAKDLKAAELAVETVFRLEEDKSHHFVNFVRDACFKLINLLFSFLLVLFVQYLQM